MANFTRHWAKYARAITVYRIQRPSQCSELSSENEMKVLISKLESTCKKGKVQLALHLCFDLFSRQQIMYVIDYINEFECRYLKTKVRNFLPYQIQDQLTGRWNQQLIM